MASPVQNVFGQFNLSSNFTQVQATGIVGSTAGGANQSLQSLIQISNQLANGAGVAMQCDQMYSEQLTLSAATTTLNFGSSGSLKDLFGNAISMARVRLLLIQNITVTSGFDVKVESAASNGIAWLPPSADALEARANFGLVMIYDPNSAGSGIGNVISSTTASMTLDPGANTAVVNVVCIGSSAA